MKAHIVISETGGEKNIHSCHSSKQKAKEAIEFRVSYLVKSGAADKGEVLRLGYGVFRVVEFTHVGRVTYTIESFEVV
jgi:hypothetical protein